MFELLLPVSRLGSRSRRSTCTGQQKKRACERQRSTRAPRRPSRLSVPLHVSAVELFRLFYRTEGRGSDVAGGAGGSGARAGLPLPEFAVFLFVQCYVRVLAESPVKAHASTSWPSPEAATGAVAGVSPTTGLFSPGRSASSPRGASPRSLALQSRSTEQAHRLQFVKKHVAALMELITGVGEDDADDKEVTPAALDRLNVLIRGGTTLSSHTSKISTVMPWFRASHARKSSAGDSSDGDSKDSDGGAPTIARVGDWLRKHLTVNELAYPSVTQHGQSPAGGPGASALGSPGSPASPGSASPPPLHPAVSTDLEHGGPGTPAPEGEEHVVRPIVISGVSRTTVLRTSHLAAAGDGKVAEEGPLNVHALPSVRIDSCSETYIYIVAPMAYATVLGCHSCTIVLGAVAGGVSVEHCEEVKVVSACSRLRISNSVDCDLHTYTPTHPIISGDCRGLRLAPHNAHYPRLLSHMSLAGVRILPDSDKPRDGTGGTDGYWGLPLIVHTHSPEAEPEVHEGSDGLSEAEGATYHKLSPAGFSALVVPVVGLKPTSGAPLLPLPEEYAKALTTQRNSVRALRRAIREMGLEDAQRKELQAAVQANFREWLATSGNLRQVTDLVRLQRESSRLERTGSSGSVGLGSTDGTTKEG